MLSRPASTLLVSLCAVLSPDAQDGVGSDAEERILAVIEAYNRALREEDAEGLYETMDLGHLLDVVLTDEQRMEGSHDDPIVREHSLSWMAVGLAEKSSGRAWRRYRVRRIEHHPDPPRAVVSVWGLGDRGGGTQRLWLRETDAGWRIFDVEFLDTGIRFSLFASLGLMGASNEDPSTAALELVTAMAELEAGEIEASDLRIRRLFDLDLPDSMRAILWMGRASVELASAELEQCLELIEKARGLKADFPVLTFLRARCLEELGELEAARVEVGEYLREVGGDPDGYALLAQILVALGRRNEALDAHRAGLEIDPASGECLAGLVELEPDARTIVPPSS